MAQPATTSDWTVQAADTVERVVTGIRDKTTVPLTTVARAIVFGQVAAVGVLVVIVLLAVTAVRLGANYLPIHPQARAAWVAEAIAAGIFLLVGAFLLRMAAKKSSK